MVINLRKHLCILTLGVAGALCVPAFAQYQQQDRPPDQRQHDQDDRNRGDDQNRANRDNDDNRGYNQNVYNQNDQWRNSKAYKQGMKDGEHDRDKNRDERADRRHWRNDQDRQAYQAGYYDAYRNRTTARHGDRDDQHRDRDDHDRDH